MLDEPLSALDKKLRERTQFELMDLQYQVGTPSEIYEFPQSRFVADFVGTTNLFEGTVWELATSAIARPIRSRLRPESS